MLGAYCGLRISECARINARDIIGTRGNAALEVTGKGGKKRVVPIPEQVRRRLEVACSSNSEGWAFPNTQKGGHLTGHYLGKQVRPLLGDNTFHSLRHRYGTRVYNATHDLLATQNLLGHASPRTTQAYVAIDYTRLAAVASQAWH